MISNILDIKGLVFRWPGEQQDLLALPELRIKKGEKVFIRGSSGSGKTTLLSLIGGINTPQQGRLQLLQQDIGRLTQSQRDQFRADHIGFIFQLFNLLPYLSVIDNIILSCQFSPNRTHRALKQSTSVVTEAKRLLQHLKLYNQAILDKPVGMLSVGQQQRVAAARALIGAPELIIADEPTAALDEEVQNSFLQLLMQEVEASDSTLVFVSHDSQLENWFDRTLSLQALNQAA